MFPVESIKETTIGTRESGIPGFRIDALEQQVNRRLNQKADQAIDKTLDAVEDSITSNPDKKGNKQ